METATIRFVPKNDPSASRLHEQQDPIVPPQVIALYGYRRPLHPTGTPAVAYIAPSGFAPTIQGPYVIR